MQLLPKKALLTTVQELLLTAQADVSIVQALLATVQAELSAFKRRSVSAFVRTRLIGAFLVR